jgi:hypothetical protein
MSSCSLAEDASLVEDFLLHEQMPHRSAKPHRQDRQVEAEFDATIRSAGEVHVVEWDRMPAPHCKFQLLDPWPGGMLAELKKPAQLPFRILSTYIWTIPIESVRVRLQDILGGDLVVTRQAKGLVFSGDMLSKAKRIEKPEDANRRLLSFLRGRDF